MREFLWTRHAESTWNALGRWQGQSNPSLSEKGRGQAQDLAAALASDPPRCVVSSDLRRAAETAEAVARAVGVEVRLEARLRERALGAWTGLQHHQVAARWPDELRALQARDLRLRPPGGESLLEVRARIASWLRDHEAEATGERTLVVTHGGLLRALFAERFANIETRVTPLAELWHTLDMGPEARTSKTPPGGFS